MNVVGGSILAVLIVVVLIAPRKWAVLSMMAGVLYLTQGQFIKILDLNLYAIRFLEIAAFIRVVVRRESPFSKLNRIDWALLLVYGYTTLVFLLRSAEASTTQVGVAVDAFLCYFSFRGLIKDMDEFRWFLRSLVFLLVPYVLLVAVERVTDHNPFAFMGGIIEGSLALVRGGTRRCMGSFRHPVLLGTFGASFLPLYIGLALDREYRKSALIGTSLCLGIVWLSHSGGPLSSVIVGLLGWILYVVRTKTRIVRWSIVGLIALLALVMKAPIWYLPAKVSSVTGGEGWHRSYLIEMAIKDIDKWWLAGMSIVKTKDWFPYGSMSHGGADITNQYISFGLAAGLLAMALFIFLLIQGFRAIGMALAVVRAGSPDLRETEFLLWGLGVTLLVHTLNWIGVTYFDQTYVVWFMHLAAISSLSHSSTELARIAPRRLLPRARHKKRRILTRQTSATSNF